VLRSGIAESTKPLRSQSLPMAMLVCGPFISRLRHTLTIYLLDWFHISMRFKNFEQLAKGINAIADGGVRGHALAEMDCAKWHLWNGHTER
jgi:hypothetical protein